MAEPSIAMIPSGYKAEKIYSVLPTNGNADLDFSRNSKATRINEQGLIEEMAVNVPLLDYSDGTCPSLKLQPQSTNLITYSESFGNSYWTKSGASIQGDASTAGAEQVVNGDFNNNLDEWLITSGVWVWSSAGAYFPLSSTYSVLKQDLNKGGIVKVVFDINVQIGSVIINARTLSGTYRELGRFSSSDNGTLTFYLDEGISSFEAWRNTQPSEFTISNVSVKEVQGFASPSVDSPLGAFKLVEGTNTGTHFLKSNNSSTSDKSFSIYAKYSGRSIQINSGGVGNTNTVFNLLTGVIDSVGSGVQSSEIIKLTDDWYICSISYVSAGVNNPTIKLHNGTSTSYTGDGTSGVYIFGAQLEQKSYATSYIPTAGTTITRTADSANGSGNASTFNDSEGVLMVEISALDNDLTNRTIGILGDSSNFIELAYRNATNQIRILIKSSNVVVVNLQYSLPDVTLYNKIVVKYKSNDCTLWVNGFEVLTDTSASMPSGLSQLNFNRFDGTEEFYGKTKQLQYYNTALTDLELETLTSYTSFNEMALAQNYIIQ